MYSLLRYSQFSNSMTRMATPILDYAHPKKFRLTFNFYGLVSGYFINLFWRNRTFMIERIKKRPNLSKCLKNPASDSFWRNLFFFFSKKCSPVTHKFVRVSIAMIHCQDVRTSHRWQSRHAMFHRSNK